MVEVELQAVGRNLAELRSARGLTLQGLANLTGYTVSYLSQIERGESVPSLSGLASVAAALGVEMRALFKEASGPRLHLSRASEPLALRTGLSDSGDPAHHYTVLGAHGNEGAYTALIHELPPSEPPLRYRHFGERFALVLTGSVRLTLGGESHELGIGDCIHYGSHEEHTFEVTSESDATVLWIVSPAIF
ncbi:helix-turn-helix domain-containing protein [Candidatus Poriferisodalis sp.]|uniref:helix-turn-helix domain-containing protein n=1 Tax=Candidatus Poriferisodalis sp. TaxID=3101277 RepID=UPI003B5CDE18